MKQNKARSGLRSRLRALVASSAPGPHTPQAEAAIDEVTDRLLATPLIAKALAARWLQHGAPPRHVLSSGDPQQVIDVGYSTAGIDFALPGHQRRSWASFYVPASGTIDLAGLTSNCDDPRLELTPDELLACQMTPEAERTDIVMHVFDSSGYEATATECAGNGICAAVPKAGTYWVTLHGGPRLRGLVSGYVSVGATSVFFEVAGTRAIDLQNLASSHYDIETVLEPDPDNTTNDGLGADATELWLLDDSFHLIDGDFAQSGVGPAARRTHAEKAGARYLVVRPWSLTDGSLPPALPNGLPRPAKNQVQGNIGAGRLRIVLNDWYDHDTDHDGLSDAVEGELGLCDGAALEFINGVLCPKWSQFVVGTDMVDPRDSDGDGLTDTAEVLGSDGKDWQCPPGSVDCSGGQRPDANQMLPRWGADPLHKDLFMEVDTVPGSKDAIDCPDHDHAERGVMLKSSADPRLGQFAPDNLYRFQEIYDQVDAHNPDGKLGVHVHFDIDLGTVDLPGHGVVRQFAPAPPPSSTGTDDTYYTPVKTDNLVIFPPQGSTCGAPADVSQLDAHKGYFAWAVITADGLTGGNSGFAGTIHAGADGLTMAHETGHHLGLSHGGPSGNSPYHGPLGDSTPNTKIVQFSPMNYEYQPRDNADVYFPGGEAHNFRPIPSVTGLYLESGADPYRDLAFLTSDTLAPVVGGVRSWGFVTASSPGATQTDLVDFDWDSTAGQGAVAGPVQAPSGWGGAYTAFPTKHLESIPTMHMQTVNGSCAGGNCEVDTMRMAGSPVGVVGAGVLQIVSTTNNQPASASWTAAGTTFKVAKFQGLASTSSNECEFHNDSCSTFTGETDVTLTGGGSITTTGPWSAGVARLSDGSVALAWTHGDMPGGKMNEGGDPVWHAPRVAFAPGGDLAKPLNEISLPVNPTSDALSVAAWNETDGSPSAVTLVVREAGTGALFGAACTQTKCSATYLPIVDSSGAILSSDSPVLMTRQRADGKNDLYLLCSNPPAALDPGALRLFRLEPGGGLVWQPAALLGAVPDTAAGSALSATFTSQTNGDPGDDRLVVVFGSNETRPIQYFASTRGGSLEFVPQWTTAEFSRWAPTRQYNNQTFPGSISTFFRGDPPGVDPELAGVTHLAVAYRGPYFDNYGGKKDGSGVSLWASGAAEYTPPEWEYAEDSTLAWGLCQALGKLAAPDLVSAATYPFECPSMLPSDAIYNSIGPILSQLDCIGGGGGGCLPPPCIQCQLLPAIRDLVTQPAWLATVPTASGVYGAPLEIQPGGVCSTDALFTLPYGFEPTPARVPR